ncbi:argonaute/piwi family protein [Salinibacter sp.]|uniref:argonaute/piwi family protein n=2 Tax=Salinibacter sp. TaxID=2065818 RepID=UPI0021E6E55E|nr:hypothetical protein [Salinibacter sp.]
MRLYHLDEPRLQFAEDTHVCPRAGITQYGVYDSLQEDRSGVLKVGAVGTGSTLDTLDEWMDRCRGGIAAPTTEQPRMSPRFPGFSETTGFRTDLVYDESTKQRVPKVKVDKAMRYESLNDRVAALGDLYLDAIEHLASFRSVDVIVCVLPKELRELLIGQQEDEDDESDAGSNGPEGENKTEKMDFRRFLKAEAMPYRKPLQLIWEENLTESPPGRQNDATRAWNLMTALYYKASLSIPWKLVEDPEKQRTCYVGIGFYESRDEKQLRTTMAQIFDEMGQSVILRGNPILPDEDKDNRRPYLGEEQAHDLLSRALEAYEQAVQHLPARLVLHKSSHYRDGEIAGFKNAILGHGIDYVDFVDVQPTQLRLFREGDYPPYRGTAAEIEDGRHLLYTFGSNKYYRTHPGLYISGPVEVRRADGDASMRQLCREVLALTKMNWNNTRMDGKMPITLRGAKKVGRVMKYVENNSKPVIHYRYYM